MISRSVISVLAGCIALAASIAAAAYGLIGSERISPFIASSLFFDLSAGCFAFAFMMFCNTIDHRRYRKSRSK
jgi:hypothetical protein